MRTEFLCISVLASGPRVKLASCKSDLTPFPPPPTHTHTHTDPVVYSTDRSKAVVPVLVLLCCFVVNSTRRFVLCLTLCHFVLVFFSPFSISITSLGEERANLSAIRTFVRFVLVWTCRLPLHLGVREGLRFMIVALPRLFSYLFDGMFWLGPPWFNYWFSFTLAHSRISHENSSLFIIVITLILCFRFDALNELGIFMQTDFLCIAVLRVASGPRIKLAGCKNALNSR